MPDRVAVRGDGRQVDVADALQGLGVQRRGRAALVVPAVQQRQLVREHDRLDRVEPRREADQLVVVLRALAVLAERLDARHDLLVVGDERSRVAEGAEVLARIEAEGGREAELTGGDAVACRAVGLAGVLDDRQAELDQRAHVRQLPVEVHRHDEARALGDRSARRVDIHVQVGLGDVDRHGRPARLGDRLEGRDEGVGRHEHLVARLEAARDEGETERVQAAREADAGSAPAVGGERVLEHCDRRAVREGIRVDQLAELLEELGLQRVVGGAQVEKRDRSCKSRISEHALNVAAPRAGHHTTSA